MSNIDAKKAFGTVVRDWRKQLGFSQEELAERANLHRTYVSSVERGARNISLENIERLAGALEISVAALFPQAKLQNGPADANKKNGHGKNLVEVLLVEDDVDDVELALRAFKKARFTNRVQVIDDGAEALDYVFCRGKHAHRNIGDNPQIILLDLGLPKMSGMEVLRRLKTDKKTRPIPVVILTASRHDHHIVECRRLGVENYIVKPVNFQRLSEATPRLNLAWALLKLPPGKSRNIQA